MPFTISPFTLVGDLVRRKRNGSKLRSASYSVFATSTKKSRKDSRRSEGSVTFNVPSPGDIPEGEAFELDPSRDTFGKRASKSSNMSAADYATQLGPKRASRLVMTFRSQRLRAVNATEEMVKLDTHMQDEKRRQSLVQALLSCNTDYAVKIRFCSAVDRLELVEDAKEKEAMVEALIELFLTPGSMFFINTVSKARTRAITKGQNELMNAKLEVLEELSQSADIMNIVNRLA